MNRDARMPGDARIRVLICNKHTLFREGIKAIFHEKTTIEIVGEAATAEQALQLVESLRPDVVLLDAATPGSTGSEATRRIKAMAPYVEVLIMSLQDDELLISGCIDAGAAGCIRSDDRPLQLKRAISTACGRVHHAA